MLGKNLGKDLADDCQALGNNSDFFFSYQFLSACFRNLTNAKYLLPSIHYANVWESVVSEA